VDECKPLVGGIVFFPLIVVWKYKMWALGRGLHSSTFRLDVSTLWRLYVWSHTLSVTKRLRLSWHVDECKPLALGALKLTKLSSLASLAITTGRDQ
jgi:hypothetical protein